MKIIDNGGGWFCDGCGIGGQEKEELQRYRCAEGCDFDYCSECIDNSKKDLSEENKAPIMAILNYLNEEFFFPREEYKSFSKENLEQFLLDYTNQV